MRRLLRPRVPDASTRQRWLQQLATLLQAGIALQQALALLSLQLPASERLWWLPITEGIEQGHTLSHCLRERAAFPSGDLALLAMAERAGRLEQQLVRLSQLQSRRLHLQGQMRRAIRYPACVLAGALGVTAFLLGHVVPGFAELYHGFGAELPWLTRQVMTASDLLHDGGPWLLLILSLLSAAAIIAWQRAPGWRKGIHRTLWSLPVIGAISRARWLGQWHRGLAETLTAGLPFVEALAQAGSLVSESPLATTQSGLQLAVSNGQRLSAALREAPRYPPVCSQMIAVGEESGMLALLLQELARQFEDDLDLRCEQSLKLLEPLLMAGLGVLVGIMVMALYLPLFQLGQVM